MQYDIIRTIIFRDALVLMRLYLAIGSVKKCTGEILANV